MDPSVERELRFEAERLALTQRHAGLRHAENERAKAARLAAIEAEELARTKARQAVAEEDLKAHLRLQFLKNPAATAEDFVKQYPKIREEFLHRETIAGPERERQALAARGDYGF